jgi:hypothetical protein
MNIPFYNYTPTSIPALIPATTNVASLLKLQRCYINAIMQFVTFWNLLPFTPPLFQRVKWRYLREDQEGLQSLVKRLGGELDIPILLQAWKWI